MFFLVFFNLIPLNFCTQTTEIKFFIRNVPTLFRCEKDGQLLYFNQFPTNDELIQANSSCDFILPTQDQCVHLEIEQLRFGCRNHVDTTRACNHLVFKTSCYADRATSLPLFMSRIFTEYSQDDIDMTRVEVNFLLSESVYEIVDPKLNTWVQMRSLELDWCCKMKTKNYSMNMNEIRTNQIVFEDRENNILNMMCECVDGLFFAKIFIYKRRAIFFLIFLYCEHVIDNE